MANIKKIQVNGVEYEVYDEAAHRLINRVRNEMPADLTENAQGRQPSRKRKRPLR